MILKSYKNLILEIEYLAEELKHIEKEIELYKKYLEGPKEYKGITYSDMPKGNNSQMPLDKVISRIIKLQQQKQDKEQLIGIRKNLKEKVEDKLLQLEGLDNQVVYMRDVKGMKLQDIADELGYSYEWIKEVSARNKITYQVPTEL